jgi:hypothetical protein
MATASNNYAAKATVAITLTSLANNGARESTVIDNTTNKYLDARLRIKITGQSGGTAYCNVWGYSALGDTTYTDGATGSDAAFTASNLKNAIFLGVVNLNSTTPVVASFEGLAAKFGGTLPDKFGIIIENKSGAALSATAGDHVVEYEGMKTDIA